MTMRLPLFILTSVLFAALFYAVPARAQVFDSPPPPPELHFGGNNAHLKTLLDLQSQMQLLKRLIDHERAVNKIVDAAIGIGLNNPAIPPPEETLCAQVPANIPCAQSFPQLYKEFSVASFQPAAASFPAIPPALEIASSIPPASASDLPELPAERGMEMTGLFWTDITCLAQKCSAVVSPTPSDLRARYRINPGETLPDGSVIQKISAAGVTIERGKKIIQLDPAPQV